jgi:hypothetical protein
MNHSSRKIQGATRKHTGSALAGAVGSIESKFVMRGVTMNALS